MKHLFIFFFLSTLFYSCGGDGDAYTARKLKAKQDLSVTSDKWKPTIGGVTGQAAILMDGPTFTITNKSKERSYKRIDLSVYFYNALGNKVDSNSSRVHTTIAPGQSATSVSVYPPSSNPKIKRAVAVIASAEEVN